MFFCKRKCRKNRKSKIYVAEYVVDTTFIRNSYSVASGGEIGLKTLFGR